MQVLNLRGSNLIEVMDAKGQKLLAIFPAKFQRSMWIKRGNFVVVDESGREGAIEAGRKVEAMVTQVLYHDQVRILQKSPQWPETFKSTPREISMQDQISVSDQNDEEGSSSDDDSDGLPPLEANPMQLRSDATSESDSETDDELSAIVLQ